MAAGALFDICGAGLQPLSSEPWGSAATVTSQHLILCMAYALVHYSIPGVTAPMQDIGYVKGGEKMMYGATISMQRGIRSLCVFSYERNFLEQSSTSVLD